MVHGHHSTELPYIRPFECRLLYHPVSKQLPTFEQRLYEGVCLGHEGGGVYNVLTVNGIIRTKGVRPFEEEFPVAEDIWIRLTNISGINSANGQIVKLRKSLYGLRQAPKLWYQLLSKFLD